MLSDKRLIAILGLSRGGTNHLAQCIHACEAVVGLTEGISRLIQPTRKPGRQILTPAAVQRGVFKPTKRFEAARIVCLNKVNYTLVAYPGAWVRFLAADNRTRTIVLLRNPLMIHQSRLRFVRTRKPQRTRWTDPHQLGRELLELLAMAWRLPEATIVFHEAALADGYAGFLQDRLDLKREEKSAPESCPDCDARLRVRRRESDDPNDWLFCPSCQRFIEGEGEYNFLRREEDLEHYRRQEAEARDPTVLSALRESVGTTVVDFFLDGRHWTSAGPTALRQALDAQPDRWRPIRLDEILYPY
ncbi:MAG: hypothetical protein ACE5E1_05685 [Phycisphaerae bacterium]